ncbi:LacI family DNA-binding transcriptional regulator [Microbacterium sp. AK031]|uniref:LacI family DNA-binding transcriptional regulator n=1 Tax=Microbacterium sp. AK031 TaxID=2723076 RepID=UPI002169FAEB|nr:LacI family DNA-binding transcriptional regulator [Microbacterium sp. AK031]MCS3844102.1 LacI family transcriptional regulator [Microbacterium sp. AK031]
MATLSDVAAAAGVSTSAVSRVLSGAPETRVSAATRQRIVDAARQLGYRPNFAARALKLARTNVVAVIVPDLTNALFAELMAGVEDQAARLGYMVLLASAERLAGERDAIPNLLREGRVDGIVIQPRDAASSSELESVADSDLPVVLVNSQVVGHRGSVLLDDGHGIEVATRHLVELGHRRIAYLGGEPRSQSAQRRRRGFVSAMEALGLAIDPAIMTGLGYRPEDGASALDAVMECNDPPTGVVVANVNAALGALLSARRRRIKVPEDISIVALHDSWTAETAWPPLTTIRMPLRDLGAAAISMIDRRIVSGVGDDIVVADHAPTLVLRESTASAAG